MSAPTLAARYREACVVLGLPVWRQKEQALREMQSVDCDLRRLLPGGGDR
jgi:hypothetical protein